MSKTALVSKIESFEAGWGKILTWCFRLLLLPFLSLGMYSATLYLNEQYVTKEYFNQSMQILSNDKKAYANEVKNEFVKINDKLDLLIISNAGNNQKFSDFERRLAKAEDKIESLRK